MVRGKGKTKLTDRDAEELKQHLHQAMGCMTDLTVDCSEVTGIDAACLRLLCSTYRMSRQQSGNFTPKGHAREVFLKAAHEANYAHCVGCGLESEHGCVWGVC